MTKNVEEKTVQPETVRVDVATTRAEPPEAERTLLDDKEERQKTQSRRISDREGARHSGPDESAHSMSGMNKLIEKKVIKKGIEPIAPLMTLSKKHAAVAAARSKIVSASASRKKAGVGMFE